jgi:hypothetical protein
MTTDYITFAITSIAFIFSTHSSFYYYKVIERLCNILNNMTVKNEIDLFNTHKNSYLWNQKILTVQ